MSENSALIKSIADSTGYTDLRELGEAGIVGIARLMYTHAILAGINDVGYENRWCYHSYFGAWMALEAWDGIGEPSGWHRHPNSGRRRDENGIERIER